MIVPATKAVAARKYMVLYRRSLLAQGLATLLRADQDAEVISADMEQEDPLQAIHASSPDVLILDMSDFKALCNCLERLLREHPNVKIVCLDSIEGVVHVLKPQRRDVGSVEELLAALWEET